jgi:phenylacetate-coenzyme A ligase PaaK-like adenylate-forming protein
MFDVLSRSLPMLTEALLTEAREQALQAERLSPQALEALQQSKLRELLRHAAAHSRFYARLYQGIDLERAPLADLPPVKKATIQEHFDEVVTDPRLTRAGVQEYCRDAHSADSPGYLGEYVALMTSGTSGGRGYYVWDAQTLADAAAQEYRQSHRGGEPAGEQRFAAVMQVEPHDATNVLMSLAPGSRGAQRLIDIRQKLPAIVAQLNDFQPTALAAYPYLLSQLTEEAAKGRLHIHPRRITSSADVLTTRHRQAIRRAFGCKVYNFYCSTEFPFLAWECEAHDGLHVNADYVIVESVDARDRPVPVETLGKKILVTNLSNRVMPLIRYEMSDQVAYTAAPCPCGCPLPRIRTVAGREEHILSLPGPAGEPVAIIEEYVDDFLGGLDGVVRYQVIQETADRLTLNVVTPERGAWEHVRRSVLETLERCLREYGVAPERLRVDVRAVEELEPLRPGARKVCRFWNRSTSAPG